MTIRIAWLSRHDPLPAQVAELSRLFPGHTLLHDRRPFGDAADIIQRLRSQGIDEVVIVAPLSVIAAMCQTGLRPLRADMDVISAEEYGDPDTDTSASGRFFRFRGFSRILRLELVTIPLSEVPA